MVIFSKLRRQDLSNSNLLNARLQMMVSREIRMLYLASRAVRSCIVAACTLLLLVTTAAAADPINLKLSFFSSDRSRIFQSSIKPFVDAINAEGRGLVHIDVAFSGAISGVLSRQAQLVADGTVDLALVVPGATPDRFHDTSVMELPGLFHDAREASRVFARLTGTGALAGYEDFFVIGAFGSGPEGIHSRRPIASSENLKGLTVRVNNQIEAGVLQKFNAIPVLLAINQTSEALSDGTIDGATVPPSMLFEFGIGRVAPHHFMMGIGAAPTALLMNRKKFDSLPPEVQSIVCSHSGEWLSGYSADRFDALDRSVLKSLEADPGRIVVFPSVADGNAIEAAYSQEIEEYVESSDHNRALLARVRAELAMVRGGE